MCELSVKTTHLARHRDLLEVLKPYGAFRLVGVVENDGHAGFGDACLTTFVDKVLLVCGAHLCSTTRR